MKKNFDQMGSQIIHYSLEICITGVNPQGLTDFLKLVRKSVPSGCAISKCSVSTKKSLNTVSLIDIGFADVVSSIMEGGSNDDSKSSSSDQSAK